MFNSCLTCFSIASVPRSEAIALCAENASVDAIIPKLSASVRNFRSEEHTSELQSQSNLVCRLLLEKKKKKTNSYPAWLRASWLLVPLTAQSCSGCTLGSAERTRICAGIRPADVCTAVCSRRRLRTV